MDEEDEDKDVLGKIKGEDAETKKKFEIYLSTEERAISFTNSSFEI
jgi:hypothetical protein